MIKLILILIFSTLPLFAQDEIPTQKKLDISHDFKIGGELYRNIIVGGVLYNINASKHSTFYFGIEVIGMPTASVGFKFPFRNSKFSIYPKVGGGVSIFVPFNGNLGLGVKYKLSRIFTLLLEFNQYYFTNNKFALGNKYIYDYPLRTLLVGVEIF